MLVAPGIVLMEVLLNGLNVDGEVTKRGVFGMVGKDSP